MTLFSFIYNRYEVKTFKMTHQLLLLTIFILSIVVRLTANYNDKYITVEQLGKKSCGLNGVKTQKNHKYVAKHGDTLELIYGNYPHKFEFIPPPSDLASIDTHQPTENNNKNEKKNSIRQKRSFDSDSDDDLTINTKKMKNTISSHQGQSASNADKKNQDTGESSKHTAKNLNQTQVTENSKFKWKSVNGSLFIMTSSNCEAKSKIAAYDLDGTLITTKSGYVFPQNESDWKILYPNISRKLKELFENDHKIVIFTNQNGIESGYTNLTEFKRKIEAITEKLDVPFQVFVAGLRDFNRKPLIGMWQRLSEYENDGIEINKDASFYVGDAAGRPKNWMLKAKKDHSSADRLFAINVGLKFLTPEEHFLGYGKAKFDMPKFDPKQSKNLTVFEPSDALETAAGQEVIIMVGGPGSGKSFVVANYLQKYDHINRDKLGSWQKCVTMMEKSLDEGKSVVIDNTNPDVASRKRFIDVAVKKKVTVRCFVLTTTPEHAKHNNKFRELTDKNHTTISDIIINSYYKNYVQPQKDEGYSQIVKVNFVPKFKSESDRKLYSMYLLDK
ncbi:uncharacterized protein F21D5.5 isoform X2 [Microplitis demolitor]|uniref:uncharacterized protein F21D5.5 isoform X2 n=2 Tax=Microplitis demolitor TaxID=69319 RepID=UPI0006D4D6F2|nr:uncharacterized protein F21D5.5 isoform X2 [Microplitis demolitor]